MKADDCVHCPHCDHHLCTRADVRQAMDRMREQDVNPEDGGWTVCPACASVIHMRADGEHVKPTEEQMEKTDPKVKEAIGLQVWMARTIIEGAKHNILVSFARVEAVDPDPVPVDLPKKAAVQGSTARH